MDSIFRRMNRVVQDAFRSRKKSTSPRGVRTFRRLSAGGGFQPLEERRMLAGGPAINTTRSIVAPGPNDAVAIVSQITDTASITSASLTYSGNNSTPFTETFGSTAINGWSGAGDNSWTAAGPGNVFRLNTGANYQTSTTNVGLVFNASRANTASITTTNSVNLTGFGGSVSFWVQTLNQSAADGWAFQIDATGTGNFVTCLSETANSHAYTQYTYNFTASQLTSNAKLRFVFTGGGTGDTGFVDLDQISVNVTSAVSTAMTRDVARGPNAYTATIPAKPAGSAVNYYVSATDADGVTNNDPATAPAAKYSYIVRAADTAPSLKGTSQWPASPQATAPVWITTLASDESALTNVRLQYDAGAGPVSVSMFDDGAHEDGAAGDGMYGAAIPAFAVGSKVRYVVSAANDVGLTAQDPVIAPSYLYSYTVQAGLDYPVMNAIPGGSFEMGDHFNRVDPNHPSDEIPVHTVTLDAFKAGKFVVTNNQYTDYLNSALAQGVIRVQNGLVYGAGPIYGVGNTPYAETRQGQLALYGTANPPLVEPYSGISWNGAEFSVVAGLKDMPAVGVYWDGAVAYTNWLSVSTGYQACYTYSYDSATSTPTWTCDFTKSGFRLPTEAEFEYAATGGNTHPYYAYPWGNDPNTDGSYANNMGAGSPYAQYSEVNITGAIYPWATPVGFYNGQNHLKTDFNWPGSQTSYQTSNAENGYGLYDVVGNVWQWTNDWFASQYYAVSPSNNPTGPAVGDVPYHTLRGGSWAHNISEATISNRNPSVNRQPLHDTTYAAVGFRVVLKSPNPVQPGVTAASVATNLQSGQGVASDASGNIYYADAGGQSIAKVATSGPSSVFQSNLAGVSGVKVDARGNVIAVQTNPAQVVSISPSGTRTVLAARYNGLPFNAPYELWIDPQGGIYLTDPVSSPQQSSGVYYISPDRTSVSLVNTGLAQPKGITGTADGSTLYVSDAATNATYTFHIQSGVATNKSTFAPTSSTAMDIDRDGNVVLATSSGVLAYGPTGTLVMTVPIDASGATIPSLPATPVGLSFGGVEKRTLFVTTLHGLYALPMTAPGVTINGGPTITGTTREIINPQANDTVWVTSNVVDDGALTGVQLSYTIGGTGLPIVQFTESMSSVATATRRSWDGLNADHAWTVTQPTGKNYVTQVAAANFGGGNANGLRFSNGTSVLTDTMVTTVSPINTGGSTATIEFYMECNNNSATETLALQVNGGSGWETVFSENNLKHSWQKYTVTLSGTQLSSNMLMRFAFAGNGTTDAADVDSITVTTTFGTTTVVSMFDDGLHHDGAAGDSVFGASIPALALNSVVTYHVLATDNTNQTTADPAGPPFYDTYKVGQVPSTLKFNEVMANATSFVPTLDYPSKNLGLLTSSNVGANSAGNVADGYVLVPAMSGSTSYLVDMQGNVVNQWVSSYTSTGRSVVLTRDGDLIRTSSLSGSQNPIDGENVGGVIERFNWQGDRTGYFVFAGTNTQDGVAGLGFAQHHNMMVMPNGNILLSTVQSYTADQALAAGFNPANLFGGTTLLVDGIVEVAPDWVHNSYTIVWQWSYWNHLVQNYKTDGRTFYTNSQGQTVYVNNYAPSVNDPYKLNANFNGANTPVLGRLFGHDNGLDYNAALDQIVVSARVTNEIYIIDHSTTSDQAATGSGGRLGHGGDFVYRWGNPAMYGAPGNQTLFMQHNVRWIPAGYPGAGNLTAMNNGNNRPGSDPRYTVASEWTPPLNASGGYTMMANGAYGPTADAWTYTDTPPDAFYNSDGGGVERLPNGDTLISFDTQGLVFAVTADGHINWQFQNGNAGSKGATQNSDVILFQGDALPPDYNLPGGYTTTVYNCPFYPANYFNFTTQRLVGHGTIEKYRTWIELYNTGSTAVDLSGMYLSTNVSNPTMWQVPAGNSIPAHGYIVFYADGQTDSTQAAGRHTNFTLSSGGGSVYLFDTNGITPLDSFAYPATTADATYGKVTDGAATAAALSAPSPGYTNDTTPPSAIALSNSSVGDFLPVPTTVGTLATTDGNPFDTFTYALVSGPGSDDNAAFAIQGSTLVTAVAFNSNVRNSYSIRVRSTDSTNLSVEQVLAITITHTNQPPSIVNTRAVNPALPNQAVNINSTVTDSQGLTNVDLWYANYSQIVASNAFSETFGSTVGAWSGTSDNVWATANGGTNPFKLATGANYQSSTTLVGLQFTASKSTFGTMTSPSINVAGVGASVSFWVKAQNLTAADGWALQLDTTGTGNNFTTALSETNVAHGAFTQFTYNLTSSQLVSNLLMRFAFTGGGGTDTGVIQLDQIVVTLNSLPPFTSTPMFDDGLHNDGAAGDHVFGATIPGQATGSSMKYYIAAANNVGLSATAPTTPFSFTVQANQAPTDITLAPASVAEKSALGTTVGTLTTTDPDVGNTFTYTLVTGVGSTDNAQFSIVGDTLKSAAVFDVTAKSSYGIRVRSTDQAGSFVEKQLTITVTDVNDPPVATSDTLASFFNTDVQSIPFATLLANDSAGPTNESGQTLTIIAVGAPVGGTVQIVGNNVVFTATAGFSGTGSFQYTVQDNGQTNGVNDFRSALGTVSFNIQDFIPPTVSLSVNPTSLSENGGTVTVFATLNNPSTQAVTVNLSFSGTASATDYTASAATITIGAGQTTGSITLTAASDGLVEGSETVIVDITGVTGGTENGTQQVTATITDVPPPTVLSVVVNAASGAGKQRSMVTDVTATLSGLVTIDPGAFTLAKLASGGALIGNVNTNSTVTTVGGNTVVRLTFSGTYVDPGGSLSDGNYSLTIDGSTIRETVLGLALDGDGDGVAGGNRVDAFFRLFGDSDGDRDVDNLDYARFRSALGKFTGDASFLAYFNYDGDTDVDTLDYARFRARFGTRLLS